MNIAAVPMEHKSKYNSCTSVLKFESLKVAYILRAVSSSHICTSLSLFKSSSRNFNENHGNDGEVKVPCRLAAKRLFAVMADESYKTSVLFDPLDRIRLTSAFLGIT